jgi:hypothetical protein
MRRAGLFVVFVAFWAISRVAGQDVIYKNDGSEIKAKVIEITSDAIKYRNFDQPSGPIRNILSSDVFMIIYEDGTKEVFKKPTDKPAPEENIKELPAEHNFGASRTKGSENRVQFSPGAKAGVLFPLEEAIHDIYGSPMFHAELDIDFWAHNGYGAGVGVGYTGKEGNPYVYGSGVSNATCEITLIPIHISSGYRIQNNPKVMPYFMSSFVITPFHEKVEGDISYYYYSQHVEDEASETAVGFNIIAGLQVKPAYIEAIFSYEKYKDTNVGGFIVAAGFKF